VPLVAMGYRYSRKTILFFVLTRNAGSSQLGEPYHMKYTDAFGNMCTHYVDRPQVISNFFAASNTIDTHNQLRQDCLKLEKKWITQDPFFRLGTTLVGINVTDAFLLSIHHKIINFMTSSNEEKEMKVGIQRFAGILSYQLIQMAKKLNAPPERFLPEDCLGSNFMLKLPDSMSDLSSPTLTNSGTLSSSNKVIIRSLHDANGNLHCLVKYDVTQDPSGRKRTKMRKCKICIEREKRRDVGQYCMSCGESFSLCDKCNDRDCFREHVTRIKRITRQSKKD
jgi:hypothetical protein